jgi:protein TonB
VEPPEPIVEPEAPDAPPPDDNPYPDDPAPTPAEAADVLTSDDPVDLTGAGWAIVDKDGSKATGGGYTSKDGKSKKPVRNPHARNDGVKGGKGTGPAQPPRPKVDRSRSVSLQGGATWNDCPFPPQADLEQVDRAAVLVSVTVSPDGSARSVRVMSDPGYGFGQQAKRCAMTKRYKPALDAGGQPITASSPPIRINFSR